MHAELQPILVSSSAQEQNPGEGLGSCWPPSASGGPSWLKVRLEARSRCRGPCCSQGMTCPQTRGHTGSTGEGLGPQDSVLLRSGAVAETKTYQEAEVQLCSWTQGPSQTQSPEHGSYLQPGLLRRPEREHH